MANICTSMIWSEEVDVIFSAPGHPLHVAPLMIRYKCGFVPLGVFPALIATLIHRTSFRIVKDKVMKNEVQFRWGPLETLVSLLSYPKYYAVVSLLWWLMRLMKYV